MTPTGRGSAIYMATAPILGANFKLKGARAPSNMDLQLDMQLDVHSFVAVCRILQSARENEKKYLWGRPETEFFLYCSNTKRGLFRVSAPHAGVGKVWEHVSATFLEQTTLDLDDCIPYPCILTCT